MIKNMAHKQFGNWYIIKVYQALIHYRAAISTQYNHFVIFTDNLCCYRAIHNLAPIKLAIQPIVIQIQQLLASLHNDHHVNIEWIPSHANIKGNMIADRLARQAAQQSMVSTGAISPGSCI